MRISQESREPAPAIGSPIKDLENYLRQIESQTASDASAFRAGVADAMRRSWSRPLATIGSSVNLDPVLTDRKQRDPKPGPALYALRALALALAENPQRPAKLIGSRVSAIEQHRHGLAIEAQDGIIVPILRCADKTSLAELTTKYDELVASASATDLAGNAGWRHRRGLEFRNIWSGMGHAYPPFPIRP
jgi:pyruvate/2-oxoglutarate dehydrogenase complex dihydrolipoamide acyltransferase (E2) component